MLRCRRPPPSCASRCSPGSACTRATCRGVRRTGPPWGVLVSEVMLQQTPVVRVEPAWRSWMARWPTPARPGDGVDGRRAAGVGPAGLPAPRAAAAGVRARGRRAARRRGAVVGTRAAGAARGRLVHGCRGARVRLRTPVGGARHQRAPGAGAHGRRASRCPHRARRSTRSVARPGTSPTTTRPRPGGRRRRWSSARWCAPRVSPRCDACPVQDVCAWFAAGRPADEHAGRRKVQTFTGTDRQVRGRVMALLRDALGPVPAAAVDAVWPDARQLARCVDALVADGLVTRDPAASDDDPPTYRLPS